MRKSNFFLWYVLINLFLLLAIAVHSSHQRQAAGPRLAEEKEMVRNVGLTDLCLFTEANYTRHLTQADFHVAFQDYPLSLEHFPSGALMSPPGMLKPAHGRVD
jgi:hypothetical protein